MKVSFNGSVTDKEDATAPAESDGLFYGAGCFETFKSYNGKFLHLDRHLRRMNAAVAYLTDLNEDFFVEEQVRMEIADLLKANNLTDLHSKVRIQVSLNQRNGYAQPVSKKPAVMTLITTDEIQNTSTEPVRLASVETTVVPTSCRPAHLKLSNMLHYRQAAIQAKSKGADDALMLTVRGEVAETSIANIFWEKNGTAFTPSVSCDILPGITRSIVPHLISRLDIELKEGTFKPIDIEHSSQIWMCNSLKELVWVSSLNGRPYPTDTQLRENLLQKFEHYKRENLK